MPEQAVLDQAPPITETAPSAAAEPVDLSAQPIGPEMERSAKAAEAYFAEAEKAAEDADSTRPRGPDGKFISTKPAEPTPAPTIEVTPPPVIGETPPVPAAPKLDPIWAEAARLEGFSPEQIAGFKDETEVQHNIAVRRYGALQRAGINPEEFNAYRQWQQQHQQSQQPQQQQGQPQPGQQPPQGQVAPAGPFKLELDETELAPELVKPFREMESVANKVLAENQQLRQALIGLHGMVQQSADATKKAANEARTASEWDTAAKATPGFVEVMGLPSEAKKLSMTNPHDPKVQNYIAYAAYFKPIYERYEDILGPNNVALARVMADAFAASPFVHLVGATNDNKTNGTSATYGPGSVVRSAPRRGPSAEPTPQGDDLAAEMQRITDLTGQAWERSGANPFSTTGRS